VRTLFIVSALLAGNPLTGQYPADSTFYNALRINSSGLNFRNISLQYERLTGEHWRVELGASLKGGRPAEGPEMGEFYPCQKHHLLVGIRCQSRGKILFQGLPFMITRFGIIYRYLLRWKHPPTCVSGLPISVIQYVLDIVSESHNDKIR